MDEKKNDLKETVNSLTTGIPLENNDEGEDCVLNPSVFPLSNDEEIPTNNEYENGDAKMSSKKGFSMVCHSGHDVTHSVPWETYIFKNQDLQHSAYCRKDNCERPQCQQMKREVRHIETKYDAQCLRCSKTLTLIRYHATLCQRPYCLVHQCNKLREKKNIQVVKKPPQQAVPPSDQYSLPFTPSSIDGLVMYNNTGETVDSPFKENISYVKRQRIGWGGNGNVFKVQFPPSSPLSNKPMVVKETKYPISTEEVNVYKTIGDHPNIVKHYLVTMRGQKGQRANIFMEECDKSLKVIIDLYKENNTHMDDKTAFFYMGLAVDAVKYLHDKGIIHKDIKALNFLLSGCSGENVGAKLADYDSAKILKNEFTEEGLKPLGTPGFASPEVINRLPHGRPADVFGLGGLLMEMKGITPQKGRLYEQVEQLKSENPNSDIPGIVEWCIHEDPMKRPTASDLKHLLKFRSDTADVSMELGELAVGKHFHYGS